MTPFISSALNLHIRAVAEKSITTFLSTWDLRQQAAGYV
jgi:hypothetical protein